MSNINQKPLNNNVQPNNEYISYYNNDQLEYRENWSNGFLHGLWEYYQPDGELYYRGYYSMNKKIGFWYYYSDKPKKYYLCLI